MKPDAFAQYLETGFETVPTMKQAVSTYLNAVTGAEPELRNAVLRNPNLSSLAVELGWKIEEQEQAVQPAQFETAMA